MNNCIIRSKDDKHQYIVGFIATKEMQILKKKYPIRTRIPIKDLILEGQDFLEFVLFPANVENELECEAALRHYINYITMKKEFEELEKKGAH